MKVSLLCIFLLATPLLPAMQRVNSISLLTKKDSNSAMDEKMFGDTLLALLKQNNFYDPLPTDETAPLDKKLVVNNFWQEKEKAEQYEKDMALKTIYDMYFPKNEWRLKRYYIAAAVIIGANIANISQTPRHMPIIFQAVLHNDLELCKLLLKNSANPNSYYTYSNTYLTPLFMVKNVTLAQLFLEHHATPLITSTPDMNTLLHEVINPNYETSLIQLYKKKGITLQQNKNGDTPLHLCVSQAFSDSRQAADMFEKAKALLEGYDVQNIKTFLNTVNEDNQTPLSIVESTTNNTLAEMRNYFKKLAK